MSILTREQKMEWMGQYAAANGCRISLDGEVGFGRECVGLMVGEGLAEKYPDYDPDIVYAPPGAYHKHPCVAVLGVGEEAEAQLYDWLKWLSDNGYVVETKADYTPNHTASQLWGDFTVSRMVKK